MIRPRLLCKYISLAILLSALLWLLLPLLWFITPFPPEDVSAADRILSLDRTYTRVYK